MVTAVSGVMVAVLLMLVQLGILQSVYDSATSLHRHIDADLVMFSPLSTNLTGMQSFSHRTLYRALSHPDVTDVSEIYLSMVDFKNPITNELRKIACYGVDPSHNFLTLEGLDEYQYQLEEKDKFLFDRKSRRAYGPVAAELIETKRPVRVEINRREMWAVGLTSLSTSFGVEGNLVMSIPNFLRLVTKRDQGLIEMGLIRIKKESDLQQIQHDLLQELGDQVQIMTVPEFRKYELDYWGKNAPVGFIFTMGTVVGFFIGFIVVYQILFTEVTNHLPHFATMKAMGFTDFFLLGIVMRQGMYLAILGYFPGLILAMIVYTIMRSVTQIPISMTFSRALTIFVLTLIMCALSGAITVRKLKDADPADVF